MHRFLVPKEELVGERITLSREETRHLRDVLRLREGAQVNVFDGEGGEYLAEVVEIARDSARLTVERQVSPTAPESGLDLTLAAAILKGEKFDLVVQKAVELGVTRLSPMLTARGDVKPKDVTKRLERWRRIGLEAAKQSGRAALMKIDEPADFTELIQSSAHGADSTLLMFSERGGSSFPELDGVKKIIALVGPEGGWEDLEIEAALRSGFSIATFGGRIMRAETAAIAITAILQHRFGDIR